MRGSWNESDSDRPRWGKDTELVATYEYRRADGSYSFEVRKGINSDGEKTFAVRRQNLLSFSDRLEPEDHADYYVGMGDEKPVLYRLPELIAAVPCRVEVTEGEKDADTLASLGLVATTNPFGALKWSDEFSPYLADCHVMIHEDQDEKGRAHARMVAASVMPHAARVSILSPPVGKDVTNWVEARRAAGASDEDIRAEVIRMGEEAPDPATRERQLDQRRSEQIAENIKIGDDVTESIFPTIMTLGEMHDRLVFVGSTGAVVDRATGRTRKREAAMAEYAASSHLVVEGGKRRKVPALKAWIESPSRVTVDALAWWPGSPEIFRAPEDYEHGIALNTWHPLVPAEAPDDWQERVEPFLEHLAYLVPIEAERSRFLQWLAHTVQQPEVLPHTAYLMTTTTTGIGRNLLASMLVRVLRGHVAAGISLPDILDGGFSGRLSRKLLAIVDEAREGSGERRWSRGERMKSLITEEHRPINPKYGHQSIEKNCCRWLMFSNHKDAIPFDSNDRRIIVVANPTTRRSPDYYERQFGRMEDRAFTSSIRRLLETLDLSTFRAGEHAPMNEAKQLTLDAMTSEVDRVVTAFREDCETELTSRGLIQNHLQEEELKADDSHLTHAILRAGMVNTGRRVSIRGQRHSVIIVRGELTAKDVKNMDSNEIARIIFPEGRQEKM